MSISQDGLYWSQTGLVLVNGIKQPVITILRFSETNVHINPSPYQEDLVLGIYSLEDQLQRELRLAPGLTANFVGRFSFVGNDVSIEADNAHFPDLRESQGHQSFKATGELKENGKLLWLDIIYPQATAEYRYFWKDGRFRFELFAPSANDTWTTP